MLEDRDQSQKQRAGVPAPHGLSRRTRKSRFLRCAVAGAPASVGVTSLCDGSMLEDQDQSQKQRAGVPAPHGLSRRTRKSRFLRCAVAGAPASVGMTSFCDGSMLEDQDQSQKQRAGVPAPHGSSRRTRNSRFLRCAVAGAPASVGMTSFCDGSMLEDQDQSQKQRAGVPAPHGPSRRTRNSRFLRCAVAGAPASVGMTSFCDGPSWKIKIKVKSSGQECPLHTVYLDENEKAGSSAAPSLALRLRSE
jgi:hypothetical protein